MAKFPKTTIVFNRCRTLLCILVFLPGLILHEAVAAVNGDSSRIEILYTQNTNGVLENCDCPGSPLGGLDKRLTIMQRLADRDSVLALYLDSGDILSPGGFPAKDRYVLRGYSIIGYDAIGLGDQEFINGTRFLSDMQFHLHLPFVSSCIAGDDNATMTPFPHIIKNLGGIRIGILSVIGREPFDLMESGKTRGLTLVENEKGLATGLAGLTDSVDLVILLSHLGHNEDIRIAKEYPRINIIVGAHSQTVLSTPERYGNTIVVQAGKNSEFVGQLSIDIDRRAKTIRNYTGTLHPVLKDIPGDVRMQDLMSSYQQFIAADFKDTTDGQSVRLGDEQLVVDNSSCSSCHVNEMRSWTRTNHAFAFASLQKRLAGQRAECARCHTTGFGSKGGFTSTEQTPLLGGVGCVECHRVSVSHLNGGKGPVQAITSGTCTRCHSQGVQPTFMFSSAEAQIGHKGRLGDEYVVRQGDCLYRIARQLYSNPCLWKRLFDANRGIVNDPDLIFPGQRLILPIQIHN